MIASSERLVLRYYRIDDVEPIFRSYTGDVDSARYLARRPHIDRARTQAMLHKLSTPENANMRLVVWVVHAVEEDTPVGLMTLEKDEKSMLIHFGIGVPYRGRGYAAEALGLCVRYLLSTEHTTSVGSFTDVENMAAQKALVKPGFKYTGRIERGYRSPQFDGEYRDILSYQYCQ